MKKIAILLFFALFSDVNVNASHTLCNSKEVVNTLTETYSVNGINDNSTDDIGKIINRFLTESKNGQCAVTYNLFKTNKRLRFKGEVDANDDCYHAFNFLYTGRLSINGKSLESYVGNSNWNVILRGPHIGAYVMEIESYNAIGDLRVDEMRKTIAKSISASLLREKETYNSKIFLYRNTKGYILFYYSFGTCLTLQIYASGSKDSMMEIISNLL